ncbi:MAG: MFS transporter, partial [Prolixibacteraceae bacterium]
MSNLSIFKKYPSIFWISNLIELFERYAWYGFYIGFGLFLVGSKETGAMGFSQEQKGLIMGTGSMLLYFLPIITGAISDRVGYKKVLLLAFLTYISGFFMIQNFSSFTMVFVSFIWICVGGAFFKPIISAMISKTTNEETASIGFGIFYMMVNIGGWIGPFVAGIVLGKGWNFVFLLSIASIAINLLITLLFFKDPPRDEKVSGVFQTIGKAFENIAITLINWRYALFLLIMSVYWAAFNQLYYTFPNFVDDWVNTATLYNGIRSVFPAFAELIGTSEGTISAVTIGSMDAFFIIVFQIMVSTFVMRFRALNAMIGGTLVLAGGLGLMFSFQSGWIILFGLLIFSLGEMGSSPKYTEYVGNIALADKKALYMGSSFLPIALGHQIAGYLSGAPYEKVADKLFLLKEEVLKRGLSIPEVSDSFTKNDYISEAAKQMSFSPQQLTDFLWHNYHPASIWIVYSSVATGAAVLLFLYDRFIVPKKI